MRDVVKLMYSFHSSKAKEYEDFRRTDPRNQVEVPLASEKELAALPNGKPKGGNPRSPPKRPREPYVPADGGGGGGNWRETTDHYGPQTSVAVPESESKHTVCGTCGGIECRLRADKSRGIAGVCKWSPEFGAHPSLPPAGQFVGSDAQKKLAERKFRNLVWGKNADGTTWNVPKASADGLLTYKKLLSEEKA